MNRVKSQSLENSHLEDEVNPRITDEHRKEEDTNTRVEGQDVAKGHERQTFPTKLLTHWVMYWQLLNQWTKQLKLRCLTLLRTHVPYIKEEVELTPSCSSEGCPSFAAPQHSYRVRSSLRQALPKDARYDNNRLCRIDANGNRNLPKE